MNYLAHLFLSGDNNEDLLIGNYITDGLKGEDKSHLKQGVLDGIELHLKIDYFTDKHVMFSKSSKRLNPKYGLYSWVIVDIFYDHFLARNWKQYHHQSLDEYAVGIYKILDRRHEELPANSQRFLWYMKKYNILYNYANLEGIARVLDGLNQRTKLKSGMDKAIIDLKEDYHLYEAEFETFFPEMEAYVKRELGA